MKITAPLLEKKIDFGDVVVGGISGTKYMIVKDDSDYARLLHLESFTIYSTRYSSPEKAVKDYFDNHVHFPNENNELILGGNK